MVELLPTLTLSVISFGCPAPSPADDGQAQLPYFQLVRPPAAGNRTTSSATLNPALRKKRHATLGGAASRTISFCLYLSAAWFFTRPPGATHSPADA
jgi:hypothetical protein